MFTDGQKSPCFMLFSRRQPESTPSPTDGIYPPGALWSDNNGRGASQGQWRPQTASRRNCANSDRTPDEKRQVTMAGTLIATPSQITRTVDLDSPLDWLPSMPLTVTATPPTDNIAASYSSDGDWLGGPALFDSGVAGVVTSDRSSGPCDLRCQITQLSGSMTLSAAGYADCVVPVLLFLD